MTRAYNNIPGPNYNPQGYDPGYSFRGWFKIDGVPTSQEAKEGVTRYSLGQVWYAIYDPLEYTIQVENTAPGTPAYSGPVFKAYGPYTIHIVGGSMYYTDTKVADKKIFDVTNDIPGYSVIFFGDKDLGGGKINDNTTFTKNLNVTANISINSYTLNLRFVEDTFDGSEIPSTYTFIINDWAITSVTEFHTGSTTDSFNYTYLQDGLIMPLPVSQSMAFSEMYAGDTKLYDEGGSYILRLVNFEGTNSATITYVMKSGLYTIEFDFDVEGVANRPYPEPVQLNQDFEIIFPATYYVKPGYHFVYYSIEGSSQQYNLGDSVTLTQALIDHAQYCVVTVKAIWEKNQYKVIFDVDPSSAPTVTIREGEQIIMPDLTDYTGHYISGWKWYKGTEESAVFTGEQITMTSEIIDAYEDNGDIHVKCVWAGKTYRLMYQGIELDDIIIVTYNDIQQPEITLWTMEDREYETFRGWKIGEITYANCGVVPLDDNMAAAGDANNNDVIFDMVWKLKEYYIRYDLSGGTGDKPDETGPYVLGDDPTPFEPASGSALSNYGYYFAGWNYLYNGEQILYKGTGVFDKKLADSAVGTKVTLYANWQPLMYHIEYKNMKELGGKMGRYAPTDVFYGEVPISFPTLIGYQFTGWTASGLTSEAQYKSTTSFVPWSDGDVANSEQFKNLCGINNATVILTAHWKVIEYEIIYDSNGGEVMDFIPQKTVISMADKDGFLYPDVIRAEKTGYTLAG
jgi:hypothetical protein